MIIGQAVRPTALVQAWQKIMIRGQGVRVNINKAPWEVRDGVDTRKQVLTQQVLTRPSRC